MHIQTVDHYNTEAERFINLYKEADVSSLHAILKRWLPEKGRVLEIGCGSGRDAEYMAVSLGLEVMATDASETMISLIADNQHFKSRTDIVFQQAAFPLLPEHNLLREQFEAIVAIAVIMHIPDHELFEFAYQVRTMLRDGGVFICSFCSGRESISNDPRLYADRKPGEVRLLFERLGFNVLAQEKSQDGMGRESVSWITLILEYDGRYGIRPVDQIESIINRDTKTATYKLALLHSLCEIAQTSFHHVRWHANDIVSIPLGLVVEKWIYYYWPLIGTDLDLPEMRLRKGAKGLAFRPQLIQLINTFRHGGMSAFQALFQSGRLNGSQADFTRKVANRIAQTIVNGPVTYSGGSLEGIDRVFSFQGSQTLRFCSTPRDIVEGLGRFFFSAGLWREMCLVGHWIGEGILLRWAELSRSFAKQSVSIADVLELLLKNPITERATVDAKTVFAGQTDLFCVWSEKKLSSGNFDIDHVIPFSLWHNNDLWNLLPADPKINNQKRDKIVTREILFNCRDRIIHCWQNAFQAFPLRFGLEVERTLLGNRFPENNWESITFSALSEAVETTARQRGVLRWMLL